MPDAAYKINSKQDFIDALALSFPGIHHQFAGKEESILKKVEDYVRDRAHEKGLAAPSNASFSNCRGDWYEWLIAISAINRKIINPDNLLVAMLPKVTEFDVPQLYKPEIYSHIQDFRDKLKATPEKEVYLVTSNPDFVIIDTSQIGLPPDFPQSEITHITTSIVDLAEKLYVYFKDRCGYNDIRGFLSAKTSLRPDRRFQMAHEGSLMKAIYIHIQTREWIYDPPGLKYYGCTAELNPADRRALMTVATHSIITVQSVPQRSVDEIFVVNSFADAEKMWAEILLP